ncbi:hypothetical protein EGW08_017505 [Elysia chlorotica]|uniref:Helicase superfamily 3 single-stranded DNA/RNA virus domain-containing protein n=1 Tax=Elysia chlorotica TaxID=188477 RepID=A0A3S1BTU6_ELYCH|nr:hypothetical protein EGW08_017505 [Elysia chlorotica]
MPDSFFINCLDPTIPIEEQVAFNRGKYAEKHAIKNYVDRVMKQNNNRQIVDSIEKEGALATVKKGYMSVGQLKGAKHYVAEINEIKEKESRLSRDVPKGYYMPFRCFKTDKLYKIFSENERLAVDEKKKEETECVQKLLKDEDDVGYVEMECDDDENFVKHKHYYFYSKAPGYGKTTFIQKILKRCNASQVTDTHNWMNVSKDAQFLVIDEYNPDKKITMGNLKTLTSGDASAFAGNRKSHGLTFQPRRDAQLIIFSNYHLFDVMGTKALDPENKTRKITEQEAKILSDRFFIYRLDETKSEDPMVPDTETEDFDRHKHTSGYEGFVHFVETGWN